MRVAAVDLGTNTTRLLVADVEHGLVEEIVRREAITRLGESVDRRRILLPTAIARVRNVLVDYRRDAEALGAVNCITRRGSRLHGDNTDGPGLVDALQIDEGITVSGTRCCAGSLCGAG